MISESSFSYTGRVWLRGIIPEHALLHLENLVDLHNRPGARISETSVVSEVPGMEPYLQKLNLLLPGAFATRLVAFNKSQGSNWSVPWHQDRVIAVAEKHDAVGYRNWSNKFGQWHTEPPAEVLQPMLFVRIHLDDNTTENGAMEIALGSHLLGILPAYRAVEVANSLPTETCTAKRGDVLVLNMLTLHRSLPAETQSSRRVLRIDYANSDLPAPLKFAGRHSL